jgi:hypothetical protein
MTGFAYIMRNQKPLFLDTDLKMRFLWNCGKNYPTQYRKMYCVLRCFFPQFLLYRRLEQNSKDNDRHLTRIDSTLNVKQHWGKN